MILTIALFAALIIMSLFIRLDRKVISNKNQKRFELH